MKTGIRNAIIAALAMSAVACTKVPAGNVGIMFDLYGGDKGVTGEVVGPGKYWLGWNEELFIYPTFSQTSQWTADSRPGSETDESITFQDRDGTQMNADVGLTYAIDPLKADTLFEKFRKGIDEITDIYLRNMVRDAMNNESAKMEVTEIYGAGKEQLMVRVTELVKDQVAPFGINVEKIYLMGAIRLPPAITQSINAKTEATQKALTRENELQTAKAQAEIEREKARGEADARLIAAKAEAEANRMITASISQTLVDYKALDRWNGTLPQVTGGSTPFIDLRKQ